MARRTNIRKRRELKELFAKGEEVRFNKKGVVNVPPEDERPEDWEPPENAVYPTDDDIIVWVQPPDPLQREQALREASAHRAVFMLKAKRAKSEEDEDGVIDRAYIVELDDEELTEFLLDADEATHRGEAQRNVLARDEWEDFPELQDGIRRWSESSKPDDDSWRDLVQRDLEFGRQVEAELTSLREASRESYKMLPRDERETRALRKRLELSGNAEFMDEFERQMLFHACRDPKDHSEHYFEDLDDMLSHPDLVQTALLQAYNMFINEERDAKNSLRAVDGSPPLEPPEEISQDSTPEEQSA